MKVVVRNIVYKKYVAERFIKISIGQKKSERLNPSLKHVDLPTIIRRGKK